MALLKKYRNAFAAAALAAMTSVLAPGGAQAQGFLEALFGGGGGYSGRSEVSFTKSYGTGTIIVSLSDRRLYFVSRPGTAISYPIGVPSGNAMWQGSSYVSMKRVNPGWTPTAEMRRENPELPAHIPGGHPRNPLGVRALYLGQTLYRIHGTDAPWTVGQNVTHGCIRLYNSDVIDLYDRVRIGARVIVTSRSMRGA
ncbi:MAG: L,D-transpeptidase [Pseudomonadota bacterium]|nr:L,D-transpeptidase [Pseudomonadota bacterium]